MKEIIQLNLEKADVVWLTAGQFAAAALCNASIPPISAKDAQVAVEALESYLRILHTLERERPSNVLRTLCQVLADDPDEVTQLLLEELAKGAV